MSLTFSSHKHRVMGNDVDGEKEVELIVAVFAGVNVCLEINQL